MTHTTPNSTKPNAISNPSSTPFPMVGIKEARGQFPTESFYLSEDGAYVPPRNRLYLRIATLLVGFSVSRLPYRFPRLHGLFSELRSFRQRIRLVWQRGESRPLQMGPLYRVDSQSGVMVENTRTQSRIRDIQRLKLECPWAACEDAHFFLLGWDAGWESSGAWGNPKTSVDTKNSSFLAGQTSEARQFYVAPSSSAMLQT
jgi:hypothetical protein